MCAPPLSAWRRLAQPAPMKESAPPIRDPLERPFVVIATYNERTNIERLLPAVLALDPPVSVLVVDDNSPDGTAKAVEAEKERFPGRVHLLGRPGKMGYGSAFAAGIAEARRRGATAILSMDADFSHDPADAPRLLAALSEEGGLDVVAGSRYVGGIRVLNWPFFRLLLSVFANNYARAILGLPIHDATSGFRAYRADVFDRVDLAKIKARGYAFLVEALYRMKRAKLRIGERPIVFSERRDGQSKMSKAIIFEAALRPWWLLLMRLTGRL
jgi:dolichol-phosphate mannosyltransferase